MPKPNIRESHTKVATVVFEAHELQLFLALRAGEISGLLNPFVDMRGYINRTPSEGQPIAKVTFEDVREGSPSYKVGTRAIVTITETLVDREVDFPEA